GGPIDVGFENAFELRERLFDFGGRHVLALPAERIADAIDEIEIPVLVLAHEVAGAEPKVALRKRVVQDLVIGLFVARIAFEARSRLGRVLEYLADNLAGLVDRAFNAKTGGVAHRLAALYVEAHDLGREACSNPPGYPPDCALLAIEIEQGDVPLRCAVKLDDLGDSEPLFEGPPDLRSQAIAASEPQPMGAFVRRGRRIEEIAAKLADVLKAGAVPAHDVVPELVRGEL